MPPVRALPHALRHVRAHVRRRPRVLQALLVLLLLGAALGPAVASARPAPTAAPAPAPGPAATRAGSCDGDGAYVWSHLRTCGWAGPATTGPRPGRCPGRTLKPRGSSVTGTIHVRRAGAVLSCRRVTGCLSIEAPDVTVRDVAIRCSSGRTGEDANGSAVVTVQNGASATLAHVRTDGLRGVHACVWHQGVRMTARALDCLRVNDGVFSWSDGGDQHADGDHFVVRNSYLHDFTTATANGHIDGYQTEGASHGRLVHNTFLMTSDDGDSADSAVAIWDGRRSSSDIAVRRNLIAGGGFAVYAEDYSPSEESPAGGFSVSDVRFTDNVFSTRLFGCVGYYGIWYPRGQPTDGWQRSGNTVLETGARVDDRNPSAQGRPCT